MMLAFSSVLKEVRSSLLDGEGDEEFRYSAGASHSSSAQRKRGKKKRCQANKRTHQYEAQDTKTLMSLIN
jgi:hypothetical protein